MAGFEPNYVLADASAQLSEQNPYQYADDEKDYEDQNYQWNFPTHLAFELRAAVPAKQIGGRDHSITIRARPSRRCRV